MSTTEQPSSSGTPVVARVCDLADHIGSTVTVQGWLANRRSSGKLHFLQVRDGSGVVQSVLRKGNVDDELFKELDYAAYRTVVSRWSSRQFAPLRPVAAKERAAERVYAPDFEGPHDARVRVLRVRAAEGPLLVAVDDLHNADIDSLSTPD